MLINTIWGALFRKRFCCCCCSFVIFTAAILLTRGREPAWINSNQEEVELSDWERWRLGPAVEPQDLEVSDISWLCTFVLREPVSFISISLSFCEDLFRFIWKAELKRRNNTERRKRKRSSDPHAVIHSAKWISLLYYHSGSTLCYNMDQVGFYLLLEKVCLL